MPKTIGVKVSDLLLTEFELAAKKAGAPTVSGWLRELGKKQLGKVEPKDVRSWADLGEPERIAEWAKCKANGMLVPAEFKEWPSKRKVEWLDSNFPLK